MSDILSQSEIDALMSALAKGELAPERSHQVAVDDTEMLTTRKAVRTYDFKRQNKFSKDHVRTLSMIHEGFSRILSTNLSGQLRMLVQVEVVSVEQMTFDEYSRSMPGPTILNIFTLEPLVGTALLEFNIDLTSAIIDRLLGGPGKVTRIRRDLTDIERTLIASVTARTLNNLAEAWENVVPFTPKLENTETNPRFVQIVPPTDPVVLITFEAKIGENTGPMSLCIPYIVLEPVMNKISAQAMFATTRMQQTEESKVRLNERVIHTFVPLAAVLGTTDVSLGDIVALQIGDILPLDQASQEDLRLVIGDVIKFRGRPGVLRNRMAVQITEVVSEEKTTDD
ncbi:MAG: flagellar motor switch protein FliM, partial [Cyanobacteria bacterium REEB65]|nr:flagellar motor switch protein FliM [Cyanobacteria bacterium REEB65]